MNEEITKKRKRKRKRKNKNLWLKITLGFVSTLIILILIGVFSIYSLLNRVDNVKLDNTDLSINTEEIKESYDDDKIKDIKNIALFGIDSEDGITGRSDSIMIATIDSTHKKLKLTSIMRDSYVNIEGYGMDKINHAYAYGGPELAIKTINSNFGLNIEDFVAVNFSSLPVIIDLLGGVDITITEEEVPHIPGINSAGTYTLNGDQALSYSRIRYATGGDYVRTERQRTVLNSLFNKLATQSVTSYPGILSTVLPYVQTNMTSNDMLAIASKATSIIQNGLIQDRFPRDGYGEGITIDGVYYLSYDLETAKKQMMDYIFDDK